MKTVKIKFDESVYQLIELAVSGEKKKIPNFIEYATMQYLTSSQYIDDSEMSEILNDKELVENLKLGFDEVKKGLQNER